jgi:hypothetical protein
MKKSRAACHPRSLAPRFIPYLHPSQGAPEALRKSAQEPCHTSRFFACLSSAIAILSIADACRFPVDASLDGNQANAKNHDPSSVEGEKLTCIKIVEIGKKPHKNCLLTFFYVVPSACSGI